MAVGEAVDRDLRLRFDHVGADLVSVGGDLRTVAQEQNLAQAIIHRLATEEGELEDIGHADYGSRLYSLVGEANNEATRTRVRNVVKFCLSQEPRIKHIDSIDVRASRQDASCLLIDISVVPTEGLRPLTITYPFRLEVE